ncbi:hypothetical protein QJS10_CPA06g01244 [Acorus calamus]|uniref:RRM domain-containing protein n=1 Tax=Acorus calamus TaxID=4465 RepID=A0AAV9EK13_ACOCL|nr:hypothetical protein QJS10_CPA06g01244 [Acorus calamus]
MEDEEKSESEASLANERDDEGAEEEKRRWRREERKKKKKERYLRELAAAKKRGICYLSRIPPHMDPLKLRQILSRYGDLERIYLTPEDPAAQVQRKRAGGFRGKGFSEGWVEFTNKRVAKNVANMLNGEQIGGKRKSSFYYDLWNIKYLSKFKWDDLSEEIAFKKATREQKLALEISAAKRERDFYLSRVDRSRALKAITERVEKRKKIEASDPNSSNPPETEEPKFVRQIPQTRPVDDNNGQRKKPKLSKDILAGIFASSHS